MKKIVFSVLIAILLLSFSCRQAKSPEGKQDEINTLARIQQEGILRVATEFNSTSYFVYRGQPMGFQYELLQSLADYMGVKLEVTPEINIDKRFEMLKEGEVDLLAANLTITKERRTKIDFLKPHLKTRQVLIQREINSDSNVENNDENSVIREQLNLAGKTVHVVKNSSYATRLRNLSDEIGDTIFIVEVNDDVESLVKKVANGEIDYTVCDENIASVNKTFYNNIDIKTPLSFYQNLAWAVQKGDEKLKDHINTWMIEFTKTKKYAYLYRKYFENKRFSSMIESEFFASLSGTISPYDDILKSFCEEIDWDWRLMASLMYQESRFNPQARSWAGAFGIMQLMPNTAKKFGVNYTSSVKQQIRAGIMLIDWLDDQLSYIKDDAERSKFVVASYNVGYGHVLDARSLAKSLGLDEDVWDGNVAECILKKQSKEYYSRPEIKYGYCRGSETYKYVTEIFERYEHYNNIVDL